MSIATKLAELTQIRTDIRTALTGKGISASDHDFADFSTDIASIPGGGGGLPATYQQVTWIQGNGQKIIDTGVSGIQADNLIFDAYVSNATGNLGNVFAYGVYQQFFISHFIKGKQRAGYYGSSSSFTYSNSTIGVMNGEARVLIYGAVCADDGKYCGNGTVSTTTPTGNIMLFGETAAAASEHRFHYCKIYNYTTLVRDFVPCYLIADDTQVGLYDLVNGVFYTGTGTGTFIKGADV